MRAFILCLFITINTPIFAQIKEGFQPIEAKEMMALCNSFTFLELFGSDKDIVPAGYEKIYTSEVAGMDNKYQVYKKGEIGVINFRGSTNKTISWIENVYSAMIPAKGEIKIDGKVHPYLFAKESSATVHAGYALAIVILSEGVLEQIKILNEKGIYKILITGHSQGGSLANMMRAYLENLSRNKLSKRNEFKTYAFAPPMCGNKFFANEFQERFCENNSSFSIINPKDPVPYLPLNYDEEKLLSKKKLAGLVSDWKSIKISKLGKDALIRLIENGLIGYTNNSNKLLTRIASAHLGTVEMPDFVDEINYFQAGTLIELAPFEYPKIEVKENVNGKEQEKSEDGKIYKKAPKFFQHNPYNYYVGTIKKYFPEEYEKLNPPYLEANL